ncbi:putative peptide methionine sulfoxide reductase [Neolecta irregularis DAH-3]|uniref:peptide-methionine (S)-S-oxide reductase n=1 Tax=Neolecta irregularis (strain DAH-3) TaxID=1198029 RepID=A0A1U7LPK8_NEOID|nr:putative peptide methionine sulfoxide reductase [Neolecta irregularis DAH-3]|eukprot:OLL24587.1 putative peptide methionine sulfoxide reductase [Neolecta irregularis DAH-3]
MLRFVSRLAPMSTTNISADSKFNHFTAANGCFWGPEHMYRKHYTGKGLVDIRVGYIGGTSKNPTYKQVCSGATGHAEAFRLTFDPKKVLYDELVEFFFRMHDASQLNRQGADTGTQYRSAIFYHNDEQKTIAEQVLKMVQEKPFYKSKRIVTEIVPASTWYEAEDYHQQVR